MAVAKGGGDPEVQVAVRRQSVVDTVRRSLIMQATFSCAAVRVDGGPPFGVFGTRCWLATRLDPEVRTMVRDGDARVMPVTFLQHGGLRGRSELVLVAVSCRDGTGQCSTPKAMCW